MLQGVGWWQGSRHSSGKAAGSVYDLGGWATPPSPIVSRHFWMSMAPHCSDHKPARNGGCSIHTCRRGVGAAACPHPHFMGLRPEQTHHTQARQRRAGRLKRGEAVISGPSLSQLYGLLSPHPLPVCPMARVTPRLPTSSLWVLCAPRSCHGAGREAPWPRNSSKPALPAEEPRPAGEPRRVPSAAPGAAPSPRAQAPGTVVPATRPPDTRLGKALSARRHQPWGASVWPCHPFTQRARHKTALCGLTAARLCPAHPGTRTAGSAGTGGALWTAELGCAASWAGLGWAEQN